MANRKNKGVKKKNGAKPNAFLAQLEKDYQVQSNLVHQATTMIGRQQMLDKVTITLGQIGFNGDDLEHFKAVFEDVEQDFCFKCIEDGKDDEELWCFKDKIDRALQQYVKPEHFIKYDDRYGLYEAIVKEDQKHHERVN